ncbi:MAG TPA: SusE domain-containing protein [Saprospiraceae bacterium]|nr:SusE domain-containing protein [Saprospiraceae bacterium]
MKFIKYIVLSGLVGFALWSCTDDSFGPVLHKNGGLEITSPVEGASWVLNDSTDAVFTWNGADYGFAAGTAYRLEIDVASSNFALPVTIGNVNGLTITVSQADINNILLGKELEPNVPGQVQFRVIAKVGNSVAEDTSAVRTISITPYPDNVLIAQLQVPGSYQGWAPTDSSTAIFSPDNNSQYEGYVYFNIDNAEYKYTVGPSWDLNYGDNGGDGSLDQGGANIAAGAAGVYKLNANLNQLTHTKLRTDWGLIGSATPGGWDADQDMTYDPVTQAYTITLDLVPGAIKFRANDDWAVNFGDDGNNKTLEYGTADIVIAEAGNYTIDLLIVGVPKYRYAITKN